MLKYMQWLMQFDHLLFWEQTDSRPWLAVVVQMGLVTFHAFLFLFGKDGVLCERLSGSHLGTGSDLCKMQGRVEVVRQQPFQTVSRLVSSDLPV